MSGPVLSGWGARVWSFARSAWHRGRVEREMDEEIAFHIASRAADLEREGLTAKEAMRQARVEFGPAAAHKHGMQVSLGLLPLDEFVADLRYAARLLGKHRGFTAITVLSLALAIGANSAIFSLANEMLFARLGVAHAEQLRNLYWSADEHLLAMDTEGSYNNQVGGRRITDVVSYPVYRQMSQQNTVLQPLFALRDLSGLTLTDAGGAQFISAELVSGNYYQQLGVRAAIGRSIGAADDRVQSGIPIVGVLSHGFWERRFGGAKNVLGKVVRVNGYAVTIVGVNPPGFTGAASVQISPDVFLPLTAASVLMGQVHQQSRLTETNNWWVRVMARAKPGVPDRTAQAAMTVALHAAVRATMTVKAGETLPDIFLTDGSRGVNFASALYAQPVYALLGLVALVLLLACMNVANLILARSRTRAREMGVRIALGATRRRIFRQMLTECLLLSAIGGAAGWACAFAARDVLPQLLWYDTDQSGSLHIPFDWRVFALTAAVTVLSALLSGLAPAWRATRTQPNETLKLAQPTATAQRRVWGGKGLIALQVALAMLLLAGCAVFVQTMVNLNRIAPGFNTRGLLLFDLELPLLHYPPPKDMAAHRRLLETLRSVPGVENVSLAMAPLLSGSMSNGDFHVEHGENIPGYASRQGVSVDMDFVSPAFFRTMQIPLLAGRAFTAADLGQKRQVAVINQALAKRYFPHVNPLGRRFRTDDAGPWIEIVGVCGDTRYDSLRNPPPPMHFDLFTNLNSFSGATYVIRTGLKPDSLASSLRRAVATIDPDLPLHAIRTQQQQIDELTQRERLLADLSVGFGLLSLALACTGVFGVLSYSVAERTREIGIRLALGAEQARVRRMVLREGATLAGVGMVAGLAAALALGRLVQSLLYGVSTTDPVLLALTALLLLGAALAAAWVPAMRAARVDPLEALRHE